MPQPGEYPYPAEGRTPEEQAEAFRAALEATAATALFESQAMSEEEDTTPALQILVEIWLAQAWAQMCLMYLQALETGDPGTPTTLTALKSVAIVGPPSAALLGKILRRTLVLRRVLRENSRAVAHGDVEPSPRDLTPDKAALTLANETWAEASTEITQRLVDIGAGGVIGNPDENGEAPTSGENVEVSDDDPTVLAIRQGFPPGVKIYKRWVSRHDDRVRPLHRQIDGESIEVGSGKDFWRWPETGQRLGFPGDPRAPLDTIINCRCKLIFHFQ